MDKMTPIEVASIAVQEVRTKHTNLLEVLEAVDILMGIHYKYALNSKMTIQEAAQIIVDGGLGWIEHPETDIEEVRDYLVKQKFILDNKLLETLIKRDDLQAKVMNETLIWIKSEQDRLSELEENKEICFDSSLETISDILEGRV